ncbi:MAG TPA: DNA recombination protein RmuC [Acidimicrobiales bacterium]|nr:DNA recombination protein RmuC [Acidimicrobiales bacterium]
MHVVLGVIAGVVFGALVAWIVATRRAQGLRGEVASARQDLAVRDAQLVESNASLLRERDEHAKEREEIEVYLESLSNRVLGRTVEEFRKQQADIQVERDAKLGDTLRPLEMLLGEYKTKLETYNEEHTDAISDVKGRVAQLLESEQRLAIETQRFNQLLGRSDHRGHWGEVQLANVLEQSGLRPNVDFQLQVSSTTEAGKAQRPDCVVNLTNGTQLAIDAKFPFDRFEEAMAADDVEARRRLYVAHAGDLRGHLRKLGEKSYWEGLSPNPEFVVCFVPSDAAIAAAFENDRDLQAFAARERVLIAGPTNLLSLLWTVAMVVRNEHARLNAVEILALATELYDRIGKVAEPTAKVGKALNEAVRHYNSMVSSFESRLIVTANRVRRLGGAPGATQVAPIGPVTELARPLDDAKWGVDPESGVPEGVSDIIELEFHDDV